MTKIVPICLTEPHQHYVIRSPGLSARIWAPAAGGTLEQGQTLDKPESYRRKRHMCRSISSKPAYRSCLYLIPRHGLISEMRLVPVVAVLWCILIYPDTMQEFIFAFLEMILTVIQVSCKMVQSFRFF